MAYALRPATMEDLEPMMRIGHEGLRPYVEALWGWDQAEHEAQFRDHFTPASISIILFEGWAAGYLKVEDRGDHLFLEGIYLGREARNQGVGAEVIGDLLQRGRREGRPVRLRVLRPNPARRLYERLGFRVIRADDTHIDMEAAVPATDG